MKEEDAKTRILNAAGEAFAELGYAATTIREICRRANVNVAGVHYYFGDKENLYVETMKFAHRFREEQTPLPEWRPGTSAADKLRDFIHVTVNRMLVAQELPWQAQLMMREMLQPTRACQELAKSCFRPHFQMLLDILDELLPAGTPVHQRHQLAFSIVGQCLFYKFNRSIIGMLISDTEIRSHFQPTQLADHITNMMLAALGQEPLPLENVRSRQTKKKEGRGVANGEW